MKKPDLGDKKMNNEQQINEGFSGENLPNDYNPSAKKLKAELETDADGNTTTVKRARHTEEHPEPSKMGESGSPQHSDSSQEKVKNAVEHKDFNSDTTAMRYPKSHPDNNENRGNMALDE